MSANCLVALPYYENIVTSVVESGRKNGIVTNTQEKKKSLGLPDDIHHDLPSSRLKRLKSR